MPRPKPKVVSRKRKRWRNKHQTYNLPIERMIDVWNPKGAPTIDGYKSTVRALQGIIHDAKRKKKTIRALGSGWSFSDVCVADGWMVNTKPLNWVFRLGDSSVSNRYRGNREDLLLSQCGVAILELKNYLEARGKSLKTSGASNGQTIAGALSTGTHGSAVDFGGIANFVVGIHLVTSQNRHVWLERKSYPVVTDSFADKLGTELIRDDHLFSAALISFGSFGIINSVAIEVEDLYLLEGYRTRVKFDAKLRSAINSSDFTSLDLPGKPEQPFHIELVANPYDLKSGLRTTVMYRRPYRDDYARPKRGPGGFHPGDDAAGFIGLLLDSVPVAIPALMRGFLDKLYKPYGKREGTSADFFYNTSIRGKAAGCAIGVPCEMASKALDVALKVHKDHGPFAAVVALRFIRGSDGLLSFAPFEKTCIVDLDGVFSDRSRRFFDEVAHAFEEEGIPFRLHWGKFNDYLNADTVRLMYGTNVDEWLQARQSLMDRNARKVFNNAFLERCGLDN